MRRDLPFLAALLLLLAAIYLPGLHNALVFDDLALPGKLAAARWQDLPALQPRSLTTLSFRAVQAVFGPAWEPQRLVNLGLHAGVCGALLALHRQLRPAGTASEAAALRVGLVLFAANPVAVYAVAYLTQRALLLATLGAVLALLAAVRALATARAGWWLAAGAAYALAVLAKENVLLLPLALLPLAWQLDRPGRPLQRPPGRTVRAAPGVRLAGLALAACALATLPFWRAYGHLLGVSYAYDPTAPAYLAQLDALQPGAAGQTFALNALNQGWLFLRYGALWLVPDVRAMAIDLRPAFPLTATSLPQAAGFAAFVLGGVGAAVLAVRRRGAWGWAGALVLCAMLLFATEFSTVRIQDPFVLYRSYLWAIPLPGLVALALRRLGLGWLWGLGLAAALVLAVLAADRVRSLRDEMKAWDDAVAALDTQAPPNAFGRWRPFLNRGLQHLHRGALPAAASDFSQAEALGAPAGVAAYSLGLALQAERRHEDALAAFARAGAQGFAPGAVLVQRQATSLTALGRHAALADLCEAALKTPLAPEDEDALRRLLADAALRAGRYPVAVDVLALLRASHPDEEALAIDLALAQAGAGATEPAASTLGELIARRPTARAHAARAVLRERAGLAAAAADDLRSAEALEPGNRFATEFRALLRPGR